MKCLTAWQVIPVELMVWCGGGGGREQSVRIDEIQSVWKC